jgi:hypothetical protein
MKILYVIQTCDNYFFSRCESTINTWLKKINSESDYVFLSANPVGDKVVGYGTADDYFSLPEKWFYFIKNYDLESFDWVFAVDDDLFCFPDRLEIYIEKNKLSPSDMVALGSRNCYFPKANDDIFCGGAGILFSNETIKKIKEFVESSLEPIKYTCGDCNFFYWLKKLNVNLINTTSENIIYNGRFIHFYYRENAEIMSDLQNCITLHYCNENDKKELYKKYYE